LEEESNLHRIMTLWHAAVFCGSIKQRLWTHFGTNILDHQVPLPTLTRNQFQAKPATLLTLIDIPTSLFLWGVLRHPVPKWLLSCSSRGGWLFTACVILFFTLIQEPYDIQLTHCMALASMVCVPQ
jgi:hypothetical protein